MAVKVADVISYAENKTGIKNGPAIDLDVDFQDSSNNEKSHAELFELRSEAFKDGVNLLIDNLPLKELGATDPQAADKRVRLKNAVAHLHAGYIEKLQSSEIKSPADGKVLFDDLIGKVSLMLETQTKIDAKKAAKLIMHAERAATWEKGRQPLVTASNGLNPETNKEQLILQIEVPRCDLTLAQKKEFLAVLKGDEKSKPKWFRVMPLWERNYLVKHLQSDPPATLENMNDKILSIPTSLRHVPGLANYSQHILRIYEKNAAGEYEFKSESSRERSAVVCPVDLFKRKNRAERQRITDGNVAQILTSALKDRAQKYAKKWGAYGRSAQPIELPVTIQTLLSPGVMGALFNGGSNNNSMMVENKEKAISKLSKAFAHPETEENQKLFESLGLNVDPISGAIEFQNSAGTSIYVKPVFISTNHAVNAWRKVPVPFKKAEGATNRENGLRLVGLAQKFLVGKDQTNPDIKMLQNAIADYGVTPSLPRTNQHRPLFLSSLEQIITEKSGGVPYGSCKSGKDRKGIETLHTDAMQTYFSRYNQLPRYDDRGVDRQNFVDIFVELYKTYHQHEVASQNTKGARGLKELKSILPKDIYRALKAAYAEDELKNTDKYGSLNKIKPKVLNKKKEKTRLIDEMRMDRGLKALLTGIDNAAQVIIPTNSFNEILIGLEKLKDHIRIQGNYSKNSNLITKLEQRIRLLKAIPTHKDFEIQLPTYVKALKQAPSKFSEKLNKIEGMSGLDGNSALEQFQKLSEKAVEKLPKGLIAIPLMVKPDIVPLTINEGETQEQAIQRIALRDANVAGKDMGKASMEAHIMPGTVPSLEPGKVHLFKIPAEQPGERDIIVASTINGDKGKSSAYQLPDTLLPEKIWSKMDVSMLGADFAKEFAEKAEQLFNEIMQRQRPYGKDSDLENNIRKSINNKQVAKYLAGQYIKARDAALYSNRASNGAHLPCDTLIAMAIAQVNVLKNSQETIKIVQAPNEAYVKAVMLYAEVQKLKVENHSQFKASTVPPTAKEKKGFDEYLEERKTYFAYHNIPEAKETMQEAVSTQSKLKI